MTVTVALPFTLVNNTLADATQVMADFNACVTGFTQAASAGANNDITALNGLITPITPAQGGTNVFLGGTGAGSGTAQTLGTTTPNTFTLTNGYTVIYTVGVANPGPSTMTIGSTPPTNIQKQNPAGLVNLAGGELVIGRQAVLNYNGTVYVLMNPATQTGGFGTAAAGTVVAGTLDLGLSANHFVTVAAGAITSFGSTANVNEPRYLIKFTGVCTIAYNAVSLITPGTANITTAINDTAEALYLGAGNWQMVNYTRANGTATVNPTPLPGAVGLILAAVGSTLNIAYAADAAVLINPTGNVPIYVTGVAGTINCSTGTVTPTADGMDGEATPTSAWGHIYLISNGTTTSGLVSTNATTPSMPAGYIYYCRVGAMRFSAASLLMGTRIVGNRAQYLVVAGTNTAALPNIVTGIAGSSTVPTWTSNSISALVPPTATRIAVTLWARASITTGGMILAPNGDYGGADSANPPPMSMRLTVGGQNYSNNATADIVLESSNIFFACDVANAGVSVLGWIDKVNAS